MAHIDDLTERLAHLEHELELEFQGARRQWRYRVVKGRVRFHRDVERLHKRFKLSVPRFVAGGSLANLLTAPLIYSLIVPITLLDLWVTIYQQLCFRAYGITRVRRSSFIVIDRQQLAYLNVIEKLNCVFCGYANGVFASVREIAGRTEQYWCPIRHAARAHGPHRQYRHFVDFGDADGYRRRLLSLRADLGRKNGED